MTGQARQHDRGWAAAGPSRAGDGQLLGGRRPIAWRTASRRPAPYSNVFRSRPLFFYLLLFLGTFLGGFLETNRVSLSLGLALKTPLGRNKVVRLALFWIIFWIQELGFHLQSIYAKFPFLFSFVCSYFFCLIFKCLVFILISCLLVTLIHVRLGFLL